MSDDKKIVKGRGAQKQSENPFLKDSYGSFEYEGLDLQETFSEKTKIYHETPNKIVNRVNSPDLGFDYSMNPYQGCEHGCVYCYARNTHHYWGFSAGLDFEQKIIVKTNAAETLEKQFQNPKWKVSPIMLSGNTDCYQPQERKLKLTRSLLQVLLKYRHPVGLITKNDLVVRDIDLLKELAQENLLHVSLSINAVDESIRRKLEPRTATYSARLRAVEKLAENGIPVNVMVAPIIPGLTTQEIPKVLRLASIAGARSAAYIIVRLNGAIGEIFGDWLETHYPDRKSKIMNQIASCHGGKISDSRFGKRMRGEGKVAHSIKRLFEISRNKYFNEAEKLILDRSKFRRPVKGQLNLFE